KKKKIFRAPPRQGDTTRSRRDPPHPAPADKLNLGRENAWAPHFWRDAGRHKHFNSALRRIGQSLHVETVPKGELWRTSIHMKCSSTD
ncbi:MAG: hypothetical protein BJ554DRAFT_3367, partial [Olpidium bornovanus]